MSDNRKQDEGLNQAPVSNGESLTNTMTGPVADVDTTSPHDWEVRDEDRYLQEKYSHSFTGIHAHSLDGKGRMVIPQVFREQLGTTFTIAPAFDFKALAVYSNVSYVRMRERLARRLRDRETPQLRQYLTWLDAFTYRDQECDGQGRVLLPARLRTSILGDEREVDIMGEDDYVRVAVRAKNDVDFAAFRDNIDDIMAVM